MSCDYTFEKKNNRKKADGQQTPDRQDVSGRLWASDTCASYKVRENHQTKLLYNIHSLHQTMVI